MIKILSSLLLGTLVCSAQFTSVFSHGECSLQFSALPEKVNVAEDFMLTLSIEAPSSLEVSLPDLQDRFAGFSSAEDFSEEPVTAGGVTKQTHRWRLVPKPGAERYRLAPFAVTVKDTRTTPPSVSSFATTPVCFPVEKQGEEATGAPEVEPVPFHVPPTAKTIALWSIAALAGVALIALALWGLASISRRVREVFLSPIERARAELDRLLRRNLPSKGMFKEFYIELTMVVRRYIERKHGIRAPNLTTEEFLETAAKSPKFASETIAQLRQFLQSADMVKFAGQSADANTAGDATAKARSYMEADAGKENGNVI